MKIHSLKKSLLISLSITLSAGLLFSFLSPKIYQSKSHVAVFRLKIENPDAGSEEARNRWVWIRDGLNIKSALILDEALTKIINSSEAAQKLAKNNTFGIKEQLRKMITIQFTGADEFNFIVDVKAPDAKLAQELNQMVFERIKYLTTTADQKNFEQIIQQINLKRKDPSIDKATAAFYEDKLRKLTFNNLLEKKQRENSFVVISAPSFNDQPVWPLKKPILAVFLFLGLLIGLAADYLIKNLQRE